MALPLPENWLMVILFAGTGLYLPGILLHAWGFYTLGLGFAVSSYTAAHLYQDHKPVEEGPYRLARHPMYLGVIMLALGALLIFGTWAMVFYAPSALVTIRRARREEEILAQGFGETWTRYCDRVPAWLPRIGER